MILLIICVVLVLSFYFYVFYSKKTSKEQSLVVDPKDFIDDWGVTDESPDPMENLKRNLSSMKKEMGQFQIEKKRDSVDYEVFDLDSAKAYVNETEVSRVRNPTINRNIAYTGYWSFYVETLKAITDQKSDNFTLRIHRQDLNKKTLDHLVFQLKNINKNYCEGAVRKFSTAMSEEAKVIEDINYKDGCALSSNGDLYYFFEIAHRYRNKGDATWQPGQ